MNADARHPLAPRRLSATRKAVVIEVDGVRYYSADVEIEHYSDGRVVARPVGGMWQVYPVE